MSDVDALMWNIEKDPLLRSTIVAVGILDRTPDWATLRARFDRATVAIPRLRQRVLSPPFRIGPPRWTNEVGFDLETVLANPLIPVGLRDFVRETIQRDANIELIPARLIVADHARTDWLYGIFASPFHICSCRQL